MALRTQPEAPAASSPAEARATLDAISTNAISTNAISTPTSTFRSPENADGARDKDGRIYFAHLDGLRFWAFVAVFLFHGVNSTNHRVQATPLYKTMVAWGRNGTLGVNFFFVLSGFLITYLLLAEHERTGRIDVRAFYIRRALRIWPLYFACVAAGFLLRPGAPPGSRLPPLSYYLAFAANFAVTRNFSLPPGQKWYTGTLSLLWSVSIEEQFYLVWPLLMGGALSLFAIKHRAQSQKLDSNSTRAEGDFAQRDAPSTWPSTWWRSPVLVFVGVCALSLGFSVWHRDEGDMLYFHTLGVIGDMALGGWAAWNCYINPRWAQRIAGLSRPMIIAGYVALGLLLVAYSHWRGLSWVGVLGRPLLAALFAFVILEQCYARRSFYKCGRSPWLSQLGTYTYSLYCLHLFAIIAVQKLLSKVGQDNHLWQMWALQIPLAMIASLILATLSYHFFELPFLRLKRRFAHVATR